MKVLYDHQAFEMQNIGGVSRYFSALISGLPESKLALKYSDNKYVKTIERFNKAIAPRDSEYEHFSFGIKFRGRIKLYRKLNILMGKPAEANKGASIAALEAQDFDVFHPTYYDTYFLKHIGSKPFVLTIHDMIHEKYPEFFPLEEIVARNKRVLAEKANKIIAVSEHTKRDIISFYGLSESCIDVVYHGSDLPKQEIESSLCISRKYILYTGTRTNYKNFYFMVSSVSGILLERPDLLLVCTGPGFSNSEKRFFKDLGIENQIIHRWFSRTRSILPSIHLYPPLPRPQKQILP